MATPSLKTPAQRRASDVASGPLLADMASELDLLGQMLGDLAEDRKAAKLCITAADTLRKLAKDQARLDFLRDHTHYEFWVHHPDYAKFGGHRFNSEGIVIREVVDSAMQWLSANT